MSSQVETAAVEHSRQQIPIGERRTGYIPTLDGWRTVAVVGVILYHARILHIGRFSFAPVQNFGERGVQLFFAISGLLICSRLLEERRVNGDISLKGFYVRRLFRIQPAAMVVLAAVTVLGFAGVLHPSWKATLACLGSYRNLWDALGMPTVSDDRYTVHFWSLAVEEQFYLLLPLLLILTRKRNLTVLLPLAVVAFFWPVIAHHFGLTEGQFSYKRTDLAFRDLLVPAVLALGLFREEFRHRMTQLSRHGKLIWLVVLAIIASQRFLGGHPTSLITCIGFPLIVMSTMLHPGEWLGRLLETRLFVFGGRISYSVYLWQQLFFIRNTEPSPLHYLQITPVNILATVALATASYYFVEKPLIRIGHRFMPPATEGRKDLGAAPTVGRRVSK